MKISFSFILILYVFFGCHTSEHNKPSHKLKVKNSICYLTIKQLNEERGLLGVGTGSSMMFDIKTMALSLSYYKPIENVDQARELLVYAAEKFLFNINDIREIQVYLHNRPFTEKNIELTIFLKGNENNPDLPQFAWVSTFHGKVKYVLKKESEKYEIETLFSETYEEAKKLANVSL